MCTELYCPTEDRIVSTLADLLRYVPLEFVVLVEGVRSPKEIYAAESMDHCLCAVDVRASFVGIRKWTVREAPPPGMDRWLIEPTPANSRGRDG